MWILLFFWILFGVVQGAFNVHELEEWNIENDNETSCDGYNVTNCSTTIPPLSSTTLLPNVTTEPSINVTKKKKTDFKRFKFSAHAEFKTTTNLCTCDLTQLHCDINCCCDNDCNQIYFETFSKCIQLPQPKINLNYCSKFNMLWRNNTKQRIEIVSNGLFCIQRDNLPEKLFHFKEPQIKTPNDVHALTHLKYSWHSQIVKENHLNNGRVRYKDGSEILVIVNAKIKNMEFLSRLGDFSNYCHSKKSIKFLKDMSHRCVTVKDFKSYEIATFNEKYVKNNFIIASPPAFNISWLENITDCPKNICIPITTSICERKSNCIAISNFTMNQAIRTNQPIVQKMKYIFHYNISVGLTIIRADLHLYLKSCCNFDFIEHTTEIQFIEESVGIDLSIQRSGNPGYLPGKPLLISEIREFHLKENGSNSIFEISKSNPIKNFLTIPDDCTMDGSDLLIKFGTNLYRQCLVKLNKKSSINETDLCANIQIDILKLYNIYNATSQSLKYAKFIGIFGNANRSNVNDWKPIVYDNMPISDLLRTSTSEGTVCSIATIIQIEILFARIANREFISNARILTVYYKFRFEDVNLNFTNNIQLTTSVLFYDLTNYKYDKIKFATAPTFDLHIPKDFFYPFDLSSANRLQSVHVLIYCITVKALLL